MNLGKSHLYKKKEVLKIICNISSNCLVFTYNKLKIVYIKRKHVYIIIKIINKWISNRLILN